MPNQLEYLADNRRAFAKFQTEMQEFQIAANDVNSDEKYLEQCRLRAHTALDDAFDTLVLFCKKSRSE